MPRSGGVYTLPAGNPVVTLTVISSAWANTTMSDIATALTGSMPTDGTAAMTGVLRLVDGAVNAPGLTFATETTSGLYRIGANQFGFSVGSGLALSVNANRAWNIPAPSGGASPLTLNNGSSAVTAADLNIVRTSSANTIQNGPNITFSDGTATNSYTLQAGAGTFGIWNFRAGTGVWTEALSLGPLGNFVFANPNSGDAVTINGNVTVSEAAGLVTLNSSTATNAAFYALQLGGGGKGRFGVEGTAGAVVTGSAAGDLFLYSTGGNWLWSTNGAAPSAKLTSGGGLQLGSPTGGDQGLGTINATGLFINGGQLFFGAPPSASSTAAVTDVGKMIVAAGNIAINTATFTQGNIVSIYNATLGNITINGTIATMRLGGTATTGNRTLASKGIATLWFNGSSEVIVSGPGVS